MHWLILGTIFELVKRPFFMVLYSLAYACRRKARSVCKNAWYTYALWLALDDSIVLDSERRCGKRLEYCCYGKREPLGFITERLSAGWLTEFLRSWSWGALRNNAINLRDEMALGVQTGLVKHISLGNPPNCYEVREFGTRRRPYLELWPLWPWYGFRIQVGWLSGGFFQVQARKYP